MHCYAEKNKKKSLVLVDNHEGKKKLWCMCLCLWVAEDREEEKNGFQKKWKISSFKWFPL